MKKIVIALAVLSLLALCVSSALAGPIINNQSTAGTWLYIASWVQVEFDDATPFFLDIEAGNTASGDTLTSSKSFTVHKNCAAIVTGVMMTPPVSTPAGITFSHYFNGDPATMSVTYPTAGVDSGTVHLVATGNNIDTVLAGLWKDGLFRLAIDTLNPEPDTAPFPQP